LGIRERQERERAARRRAILKAAASVFARHGLENTTMEMIARVAEVAVGTTYLYFSSRDDVFLQLAAERSEAVVKHNAEIQSRNLDPMSELRAMLAEHVRHLRNSLEVILTIQSVRFVQLRKRLKSRSELSYYHRLQAVRRKSEEQWAACFNRAYRSGALPKNMTIRETIAVGWAITFGAFAVGMVGDLTKPSGLSSERIIELACNFYLRGLQSLPAVNSDKRSNGVVPRAGPRKRRRSKADRGARMEA